MALARYPTTVLFADPSKLAKLRRLALSAAVLAAVCGMAAFLLLILKDRKQPPLMVNEQRAPASLASASANSPSSSKTATGLDRGPATTSPALGKQINSIHPVTDFNLVRSNRIASLGPVRLKLIRTDPIRRLYDMNVIVGRRSFAHKRLKANQPVWIAVSGGKEAVQMVVSSVRTDSVSGVWSLSERSTQLNPRHLKRN